MRRAATIAALLVVAACSGDGDDTAATTSTTSSTSSTTTTTAVTTTTLPPRPRAPETAKEVVTMLETAESVIHDDALGDDDPRVAEAAHLEQVATRALADHPEWDDDVLAALPPLLDPVAIENAVAGRQLRKLVGTPRPELPAWRIVDPAPAAELRRYYEEGEARSGVPWPYLAAVHLVETKMGRIRGTSTAGAKGPMQFLPSTWEAYGEGGDIESNRDSILAAARYLAANGGARGDMANALYRYNHSERYVDAVTRYAKRMESDPMSYRAYWGWQVYYWSTLGDVWLRVGWSLDAPRPVTPADLE